MGGRHLGQVSVQWGGTGVLGTVSEWVRFPSDSSDYMAHSGHWSTWNPQWHCMDDRSQRSGGRVVGVSHGDRETSVTCHRSHHMDGCLLPLGEGEGPQLNWWAQGPQISWNGTEHDWDTLSCWFHVSSHSPHTSKSEIFFRVFHSLCLPFVYRPTPFHLHTHLFLPLLCFSFFAICSDHAPRSYFRLLCFCLLLS